MFCILYESIYQHKRAQKFRKKNVQCFRDTLTLKCVIIHVFWIKNVHQAVWLNALSVYASLLRVFLTNALCNDGKSIILDKLCSCSLFTNRGIRMKSNICHLAAQFITLLITLFRFSCESTNKVENKLTLHSDTLFTKQRLTQNYFKQTTLYTA